MKRTHSPFFFQFSKSDSIAGITVALILIPQSLAYAQLAGLPPQYGLYAALVPPVIASFFGSSKQLATGPVAVLSLMTASSVSALYPQGSGEYITLAITIAFFLGLLQLILGFIKLGGLVSFLSHPVIYGFTNAAAIIIATTQLSKFFGVSVGTYDHHYQTVFAVLQKAMSDTDIVTLLFGIWSLVLIYTIRLVHKKLPAVLISVFAATMLSLLINYSGAIIGEVPKGLPTLRIPAITIEILDTLFPAIFTMALIGFTESVSVAQAIAVKTKERINPNKELIGQGMANIVGSFFQGYPVSGSFSRTAVNFQAGAKTSAASFFTGVIVLLTLLFLTQFLYYIPQVVLAAVIVVSVGGLVDFKKIRHIWNINRFDAIAAILTFLGTLYFAPHLDKGIVVGVLFSIAYYLYKSVHPRIVFLSIYKDGALHDSERFKLERCKNIAVIRLDAPLFFANAAYFENEIINDVIKNNHIRSILLIAHGITQIDATGVEMLESLDKNFKSARKRLYIAEMKAPLIEVVKNAGLFNEIGKSNFYPKTDDAIKALITDLDKKRLHMDSEQCPLHEYVKNTQHMHAIVRDKRETIAYYYHKLFSHFTGN